MLKSALEMDDVWCPDIHVDRRLCDKEHSNSNHLWLTLYWELHTLCSHVSWVLRLPLKLQLKFLWHPVHLKVHGLNTVKSSQDFGTPVAMQPQGSLTFMLLQVRVLGLPKPPTSTRTQKSSCLPLFTRHLISPASWYSINFTEHLFFTQHTTPFYFFPLPLISSFSCSWISFPSSSF